MALTFLDLPREIRDRIYVIALEIPERSRTATPRIITISSIKHLQPQFRDRIDASADDIIPLDYSATPFKPNVSLLRTCRIVSEEACYLLYARVIFAFFGSGTWGFLRSFLRRIGRNKAHVREIHLDSVAKDLTTLLGYRSNFLEVPPSQFELTDPDLEALGSLLARMAMCEGGLRRLRLWEANPHWPEATRSVFLTFEKWLGRDALGGRAVDIVFETFVQEQGRRERLLLGLKSWGWIVVGWPAPHPRCNIRGPACSACLNYMLTNGRFLWPIC
ncbi:MAG: hypothetical protein M1839_002438 [Geoglossum umbratile]|nr:MAG: hypothetical protein M1839_002438 [Geoglossum umbratile]